MAQEKRILVVDDDEAIRMLLSTVLRRRGFAVDTARNGVEATEAMTRCCYAVALIDLMMPLMNGWELLDWMAERPKSDRPLAIVLTAGMLVREMRPDVVAGTVRKPFDVDILFDMVSACATVREVMQHEGCPPPASHVDPILRLPHAKP
jgi:two-component system OmpR family response regulator